MKDYLQDLIQHTHGLGVIELVKVVGTDKETQITAIAEDKSVIIMGSFKTPISDFIGTFGMPNLSKLKPNPLGFNSIAYPVDELRLPQWFKELPFDDAEMEKTLVDEKIDNLLGILDWDIKSNIDVKSTLNDLFSFG